MSKTQSKLKEVEAEIKRTYPKVKTRVIQADICGNRDSKFYKDLKDKMKDIEVGLLVLNAGVMTVGVLEKTDPARL